MVNPPRRQFLVFARPRSGTAWLSNFLTLPQHSFCMHEGLADASGSMLVLKRRLDAMHVDVDVAGNCDTGLIHFAREAVAELPEAKLVLIADTEMHFRRYAMRHRIPSHFVDLVNEAFEDTCEFLCARDPQDLLVVDGRESLWTQPTASKIWNHCGLDPDLFSHARFEQLRGMRVEVDPDALMSRMSGMLTTGE